MQILGGPSSFSDDDAWFDTENDMVFQWDHDNWSTSYGGFKPAYLGGAFCESPRNPNDGIDNDGDGMIDEVSSMVSIMTEIGTRN